MKFFQFRQNNSGGGFAGPAIYVIVEAVDASQANALAENIGLYFDGCNSGNDCPCCGDRWYPAWEDGDDVPSIYGIPMSEIHNTNTADYGDRGVDFAHVYYIDGRVEKMERKPAPTIVCAVCGKTEDDIYHDTKRTWGKFPQDHEFQKVVVNRAEAE